MWSKVSPLAVKVMVQSREDQLLNTCSGFIFGVT